MALRIRRGTESQRTGQIFNSGEIVWTTDLQQLWVGDGVAQGGVPAVGLNITGYGLTYNNTSHKIEVSGLTTDDITQISGANNRWFTTELAQDAIAPMFTSGSHTNISFQYDDALGKINATVTLDGIGISNVQDDTTPTLGGNLGLNTYNITGTGDINITGDITASGTLAGNLNIDTYSIKGAGDTVVMSSATDLLTVGNAPLTEIRILSSMHTLQSQTTNTELNLYASRGAIPGSTYTANTDISYVNFKAYSTVDTEYKQVGTATVSVDGNIGGTNDLPGRIVFAVGGQVDGSQQFMALNSYGYLAGPLGLSLTALTNATTSAFAAGAAYLPATSVNGTIIYNSDAGSVQAHINGAFCNFVSYSSAEPTSSKGAAGDRKGMVFATGLYIYTCYADYTNGTPDIWARTATTGSTF